MVKNLNKDLRPLADTEFPDSGPLLFGNDIGKRAKARTDNVSALKGLQVKKSSWHFLGSSNFNGPGTAHIIDSVALGTSGISRQFLQVPPDSCVPTGVLGILGGLSQEGAQIAEGENPEDKIRSLHDTERKKVCVSKRVGQFSGTDDGCHHDCVSSSTTLQEFTISELQGSFCHELRWADENIIRSQARSSLVAVRLEEKYDTFMEEKQHN